MKSSHIRRLFLDFFKEKGHAVLPSSSLVPDDPTLLLTAAGMVQFKPYFLGLAVPPYSRVTTVQKCVRTSDIERVGETARHLTFFEMLGNFSFGDYYKREAIGFAVEFLFERLKLDKDRFWVTIYEDDDEAFEIWSKEFDFPENRIVRLGKEDNFWEAGPVGPCGPCSELIVDRGEEFGCKRPDCKPGCDCDRFLEIWNLVFMQYNKNEDGTLTPLPKKNIDTGMGLERISLLMQQARTVFETDLLLPIIKKISELVGIEYGDNPEHDRSMKIIADHLKASTFLLSDGVIPSNEGRGYVLRRLIRRSLSHASKLGFKEEISAHIADVVIQNFSDSYPELESNRDFIITMISAEERKFLQVLERGILMLDEELENLKKQGKNLISGKSAFKLYDTFGFPLELTIELAKEKGFLVDTEDFQRIAEESRERSRQSWKGKKFIFDASLYSEISSKIGEVEFTGYEKDEDEADLLVIIKNGSVVNEAYEGEEVEVIVSQTPFYPEGGGQVGDTGIINEVNGSFELKVYDTQRPYSNIIVHRCKVMKGKVNSGSRVKLFIDRLRRRNIERNHTATHLLHWALRIVLGDGVKQSGSFVGPDYFRFDFPYERGLTRKEIEKIENLVNQKIAEAHPVRKFETTIEYARQIGAIALFGEKYGDYVRVVESGDFSRELCGGTHVNNTAEISLFIIRSERSIGSGLRRIEGITGKSALESAQKYISVARELETSLNVHFEELVHKVKEIAEENERLKEELEKTEKIEFKKSIEMIINSSYEENGVQIIKGVFDSRPLKDLKEVVDRARKSFNEYVVIIGSKYGNRPSFYVALSNQLSQRGLNASELAREAAKLIGGGGGGSNLMAEAGGKQLENLEKALDIVEEMVLKKIRGN
ncbi:MAG: alanine--tRNA ligase [Actinobacteria bacterium]|nr:alanine--tRNA ligase [Actinomycetota bacterium]